MTQKVEISCGSFQAILTKYWKRGGSQPKVAGTGAETRLLAVAADLPNAKKQMKKLLTKLKTCQKMGLV